MSRVVANIGKILLGVAVLAVGLGSSPLPVVRATGSHVWWVASQGTAANPATGGSSCANPSFVGTTGAPLQAAIDAAASGDEIRVCSGTFSVGTTISITKDLTVTGDGATLPILDGGNQTRIMGIGSGGLTVTIDGLLFQNARITGGSDAGAAINVHPSASATVTDSHFAHNNSMSHHGGAISMLGDVGSPSNGTLTVLRSTFYKNRAVDGGAIVMGGVSGQSTVRNSTFVENHATRAGGAISASFANMTASHSTFVDNTNGDNGFTSATWIVTMVGNIIAYSPSVTPSSGVCSFNDGDTPVENVSTHSSCLASGQQTVSYESLALGYLAFWGSRVPTMNIGASSSAIDAVSQVGSCTGTDQRGQTRSALPCDAGAFEYVAGLPSISASSAITLIGGQQANPVPTLSYTGLTAPVTYRIASEVSDPLPNGVTLATNGTFSGTPTVTPSATSFIISARDANGLVTSTRILVDNCILNTQNGKYLVGTAVDLDIFRVAGCGLGSDYLQTANIIWNGPWLSATTSLKPFTGSYDGAGYSISGVQISTPDAGFVAFTQGATISNLTLDLNSSGDYGTAGLARLSRSTTVTNVKVSGTVSIPAGNSSQGCLGGLIGETLDGTVVRYSSFTGTVDGPGSSWNGGLIGCAYEQTIVEKSFFNGTLTGDSDVGGLIGWMERSEIRDSYAIGSIVAIGTNTGGLVGWLDGDSTDADGIAVHDSYASIQIQGVNRVGALVGEAPSTTIETSFWEAGLTGVSGLNPIGWLSDQGGTQPGLSAVSATAMKTHSFFDNAGWNIEAGWASALTSPKTWGICDTLTRPFLLWQHTATPCQAPSNQSPPPNNSNPPSNDSTTTTAPAAPSTDTTTTTTSPAASSPATTTPTTTQATSKAESSPTTTQATSSRSTQTSSIIKPRVATGGTVVLVGQTSVKSSLSWAGTSTISGKIGGVDLTIKFRSSVSALNVPAYVTAGSSFVLSLKGLKPGSETVATIFSEPLTLGSYTAATDGTLVSSVKLPRGLAAGTHRLRLQMIDRNSQHVTLWLGLRVLAANQYLPDTGYSSSTTLLLAVVLIVAGTLAYGSRRSRSKIGRRLPSTE